MGWLKTIIDSFQAITPVASQPVAAGEINGPGMFACAVVGESKYQHNLISICGRYRPDGAEQFGIAILVPEPENPYDKNAVRVEIKGLTVGYLNRQSAATYMSQLRQRGLATARLSVKAVVRGGWDDGEGDVGMYGVHLDLPVAS